MTHDELVRRAAHKYLHGGRGRSEMWLKQCIREALEEAVAPKKKAKRPKKAKEASETEGS